MGSRSFRLRAVRIGDGDRRLAGELRSVQVVAAAQPAIPASPYPMRGAFWIRDNTSRTTSHAGTARLRRKRSGGPDTHAGSFQSRAQRRLVARVTVAPTALPGWPYPGPAC